MMSPTNVPSYKTGRETTAETSQPEIDRLKNVAWQYHHRNEIVARYHAYWRDGAVNLKMQTHPKAQAAVEEGVRQIMLSGARRIGEKENHE